MKSLQIKQNFIKYFFICVIFVVPNSGFAAIQCSSRGYTITTINGVLTNEEDAKKNKDALQYYFDPVYKDEPLTIDYILNKTHAVLDITDTAIQKTFEGNVRQTPDFIKIQSDASAQVKTQKLLLVAHSQGNFYANDLYSTVTENEDLSPGSIGVYSVGTPTNQVGGDGKYLTSKTDKVIAGLADNLLIGKIMTPNTTINYEWSDDSGLGHSFSGVYLKYKATEIVRDIKWSLDKLSVDPARSENTICITPPKVLTTIEKVVAVPLYVLDMGIAGGTSVAATTKNATVGAYHFTESFANWAFNVEVTVAKWTYKTSVAVAVWTYDTTLAMGKFVGNTVVSVGSFVHDAVTNAFSNGSVASNNGATVILATLPTQTLSSVPAKTQVVTTTQTQNTESAVAKSQQPQTVFIFEPKVQEGTNAPKLVFVGAFGGGSSPTATTQSQVLGAQTSTEIVDEVVVVVEDEITESVGDAIASPTLSAPQCSQTLATDGCLLSTTTVRFEWTAVEGAEHYLINKNGEFATTTDISHDITIKDFSDYTFEVMAVDAEVNPSATSTQAVSVATIPIAINEIAWMGTAASPSDEWFEIKNNTSRTIDLSQWDLNAKDGTPHVKLAGTIAPHAYIIFERTDDSAVSGVEAHQIYTGALGNAGEQLNLSYASTTLDQTPDGAWVAGATSTRQTMERYSSREPGTDPENWGTNLGYVKNGIDADGDPIEGTPGEQNSVSTLINKGQDITEDFTLTADEERYVIANNLRVSASSTLTIEPGVELRFYEEDLRKSVRLDIYGNLEVRGTAEDPVTISSFSSNEKGSIELFGNATSTIDHAQIEHTDDGVNVYNGALIISNSNFNENNSAIGAYGGAEVTVDSSTITNTLENNAIGVYTGATVNIASTTIDGVLDDSGIFVYKSTLSIASSTIRNVSENGVTLMYSTSTISNTTIENAEWDGIEIFKGNSTITDTTVSGVTGWAGISVDEGTLAISSSTIMNVSNDGISTYKATTTISNVVVENGGGDGIGLYGGTTTITDSTISGFLDGAGVLTSLQREGQWPNRTSVPGVVAEISGTEITGNAIGIEMEEGSAIIASDVDIHDNGTSEADDIVVLPIE